MEQKKNIVYMVQLDWSNDDDQGILNTYMILKKKQDKNLIKL